MRRRILMFTFSCVGQVLRTSQVAKADPGDPSKKLPVEPGADHYLTMIIGGVLQEQFRVPHVLMNGTRAGEEVRVLGNVMQRAYMGNIVRDFVVTGIERNAPAGVTPAQPASAG